jgi:hypothetical protein
MEKDARRYGVVVDCGRGRQRFEGWFDQRHYADEAFELLRREYPGGWVHLVERLVSDPYVPRKRVLAAA